MDMMSAVKLHRRWMIGLLLGGLSTGCTTGQSQGDDAQRLIEQGQFEEGLERYRDLANRDPMAYGLRYIQLRDSVLRDLLQQAKTARDNRRWDEAARLYRKVLNIEPRQEIAVRALQALPSEQVVTDKLDKVRESLARGDSGGAKRQLQALLHDHPTQRDALQQQDVIQRQEQLMASDSNLLNPRLQEEITLELSDISLQDLLRLLSQTSGVNFVLDKDVPTDLRTTIYTRKTTVLSALDLILNMNQLARKPLSDTAFLIYPDKEDKRNRYEELTVRTFYLRSADPIKIQDMIKVLASPRTVYVDDAQRILVVRDRPSVIAAVERLVELYDVPESEVVLEVEIMEVNTDGKSNLGVQYPDTLSVGLQGSGEKPGSISFKDLGHVNSSNFQLYYPDPLAILNFKQTGGDARMLANPRIRVSSRQKAKILIGDKVPVITTTVNQTSSASMESVSYLDVGLKLEVIPEIHFNDDVSITIDLEVSNIAKEIRSANGLLAYQIGTRNATTVLRLRDGEKQVLAGLLKDEAQQASSEIPGLGWIPGIGRLFSNKSKTNTRSEIVLQITPHIVRPGQMPATTTVGFDSGTSERASTHPQRLTPKGQYSSSTLDERTQ
ncbi:hypothetical protein AYR47_20780 [Pseudomonas azotoformans]|uniref:Type II/III secretion system secretin-like domain-containing protein n=2 Tax=Pseudomonas azotoformans TaxID=47878 RepID=A0A127I142_PSEAZ|nr:hypothetical protein AYR47_20780 [Pseudomonas azotoformans]